MATTSADTERDRIEEISSELGPPESVHPPSYFDFRIFCGLAIASVVAVVVCYGAHFVGPWRDSPGTLAAAGFSAVATLVIALFAFQTRPSSRTGMDTTQVRTTYTVHPEGLAILPRGGDPIALRWRDVKHYRCLGRTTNIGLTTRDGGDLIVSRLVVDYGTLVDGICQHVHDLYCPATRRALDEGKAVSFGPLVVSRQGLRLRDSKSSETVPWSEVKSIVIRVDGRKNIVAVQFKGKLLSWNEFDFAELQNPGVFVDAIGHVAPADLLSVFAPRFLAGRLGKG